MGLGTITNVAQGARAANALQNGAWGPTASRGSNRIPDDDAGAAVIQHPHRGEESGIRQNVIGSNAAVAPGRSLQEFIASFTKSFAEYKDLSEEIAGGRFSPKTLRDRIERMSKPLRMGLADLSGGQNSGVGRPATTLDQRLKQFGASSSESLTRYKELSEEVADGRWAPGAMRDRIERMKEAMGMGGADLPDVQSSGAGQGAIDGSPAPTLLQRLQQFGTSSSESLARYKELSEEVAGGRWSPEAMRDRNEQMSEATGMGGADYPDTVTGALAFLGSDSNSVSKGSTDTRVLTWLEDQAPQALSSQKNIEPGRVLALLRDTVRPSTAKSDEK